MYSTILKECIRDLLPYEQTPENPLQMNLQIKKTSILAANSKTIGEAIDNFCGLFSPATVAAGILPLPGSTIACRQSVCSFCACWWFLPAGRQGAAVSCCIGRHLLYTGWQFAGSAQSFVHLPHSDWQDHRHPCGSISGRPQRPIPGADLLHQRTAYTTSGCFYCDHTGIII